MTEIINQTFDEERALYGSDGILVKNCAFDGPADGESALKESRNITVEHCFCNLRYPFWHDRNLLMRETEMTEKCRAALWYSSDIRITHSKLHGIKAVRECEHVELQHCDIISPEFGWNTRDIALSDCSIESEYLFLNAADVVMTNVRMKGKYSFQYILGGDFTGCNFDTKDAFWHAKNVKLVNCLIRGEYLGWYSENLTFENCTIIGTQPFCYCRNLTLIDCTMIEADLAFEKSEVHARLTEPVISIKNPASGCIIVPSAGEIIRTDPQSQCRILSPDDARDLSLF